MLGALRRVWARLLSDEYEGIATPQDQDAIFLLLYRDLQIGELLLHEGQWAFRYTAEFRKQSAVLPLIDFPDVTKLYRSDALWPFFMARIPSVSQPQVQAAIRNEGIDEHSDVDLLRRFGAHTISNPFELRSVDQPRNTGDYALAHRV